MFSLSSRELEFIHKCSSKISKGRTITASCIYGSRAAGYSRPDSDIDLMLVLEGYQYIVKYVYFAEAGIKLSVLAVDRSALERDAQNAFLGEFVVGRLLHIYESIKNAPFLEKIERLYKRRIIFEELNGIVNSLGPLCTEIIFPLEYIVFSKIRRRMSLYPGAVYSYYKTYTTSRQNLEFALEGYRKALADIILEDKGLFIPRHDNQLQISNKRILIEKEGVRLKLTTRLQEFSSYFVHTYAGRQIMHLFLTETKSKIKRRTRRLDLPDFMNNPRQVHWKLPEGKLIVTSKNWQRDLGYSATSRKRLGNVNSRTMLYLLTDGRKMVVKDLARTKAVKWAALSLWTSPVKRFKISPLFRLGSQYKASRYIRSLGLKTPEVEAVILDKKILVTQFIDGESLAQLIKSGKTAILRIAGMQIAQIHITGSCFGNIKPKNIIFGGNDLYFTDTEQFVFHGGDPTWDLAQFIGWGAKGIRNPQKGADIAREILNGYVSIAGKENVLRLARSNRYIESFYPVLVPTVALAIKKEIKNIAK